MVLDSQSTKSVPRRVRLAIEKNIDEMCPNRNSQSRRQHENLDVRSVGTTRPLRGVALFDETCDLTDEDAQEATVRACRSVNPGIIIVGIPGTVSKSHFEFCTTLCTWQHKRGALYILILTDSEDALSEEQFLALETLHRSEGSAWLGRDLRQVETGARLDSNLSAMSRVRVWTNSFTMAEHIQQEAVAREGPLHSEEFFHLLKTVIQDEAPSHAMQFAQRLRDKADEELVTPLEIFVAAEHREPDLAEELDRADEAAEAEVDEETPSPAQQRQLLRAHVNLGHPTIGEFCRALRNGRCRRGVVRWVKRYFKCPECEARPMPRTRPAAALPKCYRFNQVCGIDTMEVRNPLDRENPIRISHVICHGTRYHQGARRQGMTATETFSTLRQFWLKHYDAGSCDHGPGYRIWCRLSYAKSLIMDLW